MFDYVLAYRTQIPDGIGWRFFGPVHLTYLISFTALCMVLVTIYRRATKARRFHIRVALASIIVALEAAKQIFCLVRGVYEPDLAPLQLCSMTIFIIAIHTAKPNRWTAQLLYALSLPGAAAALLLPDWTAYPVANVFFQHSFFIHFFEVCYPVLLLSTGELRPRINEIWRPIVFLVVVAPPILAINYFFGTDFLMTRTVASYAPPFLTQTILGIPGYYPAFLGVILLVWVLLYLPWTIKDSREKKAAEQQELSFTH